MLRSIVLVSVFQLQFGKFRFVDITSIPLFWLNFEKMFSPATKKLLDYCVMLHDCMKLGYMEMSSDKVIEIFIWNILHIPNKSRVKQNFEEYIVGIWVTSEQQDTRPRTWCRFHNKLKKNRVGFEYLILLSLLLPARTKRN